MSSIQCVPTGVVETTMKKFEDDYNAGTTDLAAKNYAPVCFVTVNGGVEKGGLFTGKTNLEVAAFLDYFRNSLGGTNMKFNVTKVEGNVHHDTWVADNGTGTCKGEWELIGGEWKMFSDDITFVPKSDKSKQLKYLETLEILVQ